jgi:hypothetical protein
MEGLRYAFGDGVMRMIMRRRACLMFTAKRKWLVDQIKVTRGNLSYMARIAEMYHSFEFQLARNQLQSQYEDCCQFDGRAKNDVFWGVIEWRYAEPRVSDDFIALSPEAIEFY